MTSVNTKKLSGLLPLYKAEGWEVEGDAVWAYGKKFPLKAPVFIHLATYRDADKWETRLEAMIKAHHLLWADKAKTFNYWQERMFRVHCERKQTISFAGGAGIGKGLTYSCPVRTPSGWSTVGSLSVSDVICDTTGGVQTVIGVYPQGVRPVYRVSFSDGTSAEVDDQHLWTVQARNQRSSALETSVLTTTDIRDSLDKHYSIPFHMPVFSVGTSLPLHPYIVGSILANGSCSLNVMTLHTAHESIMTRLQSLWTNSSYKFSERDGCFKMHLRKLKKLFPYTFTAKDKYIPEDYLNGTIDDRVALLQGLLDGDGCCKETGTAIYYTASAKLADGVLSLGRSLGLYCKKTVRSRPNGWADQHIVSLIRTPLTAFDLFTVPSKLSRNSRTRKRHTYKVITAVNYIRDDETVCIKVSHPNALYLINDYIVTHNTHTAAEIACLFWLSDPQQNGVIVASTTLASLRSRIYGYIERCLRECAIKYPYEVKESMPPSIHPMRRDFIHGIYAVAATKGDDEASIRNWIGRHVNKSLLLILDEATDLPIGIIPAMANLSKGLGGYFQAIAIGNSSDKTDLHGLLSTPKNGWESVDPRRDNRWDTTHPDGVCLYFNPYESPAVHEQDSEKKALLSRFLMNEATLVKAEQEEGAETETFWRFTMGFWKSSSIDNSMMSESFLKEYDCRKPAEFSGMQELKLVAGLDPAFTSGGDKCILRLGVLGHHAVTGKIVLDFRDTALLFEIKLSAVLGKSAETQIADAVLEVLRRFGVPLRDLFIDANASGRGLADVITLKSGGVERPAKVFSSSKFAGRLARQSAEPHAYVLDAHELWFAGRQFISTQQIFGMDFMAATQLHTRLIETKGGKKILEAKSDFKKRLNAQKGLVRGSPDEADAAMLALQAAIVNYGFHQNQKIELRRFPTMEDRAYYLATGGNPLEVGEPAKPAFFPVAGSGNGINIRRRGL